MLEKKTKKIKNKKCFLCGVIGHLAKICPGLKVNENEGKLTYIPPKRIKFKCSNDDKEFKNRIQMFKSDSHQYLNLQSRMYKPILKEVLFYLIKCYENQKNLLLHSSQIKLAFTDNFKKIDSSSFQFAETSIISGYITFSVFAIENKLMDNFESGYTNEQKFIKELCKNKEEILFWILIHEFTHLFDGYNNDRHDDFFFEQVNKFAEEQKFLFSL